MTLSFTSSLSEQLSAFETLDVKYRTLATELYGSPYGGAQGDLGEALRYLIRMCKGAMKVAPFAKGDRVELAYTPDINMKDSWGWMGSKHFLIEGAKATVDSVELHENGFSVYSKFDDESWISNMDGKKYMVEVSQRHQYGFRASSVRKIDEPAVVPAVSSLKPCSCGGCS